MTTPTWPHPIHGELGILHNDGDRVQCHACGNWYLHLGSHTFHAHGLTADDYRRVFGPHAENQAGWSRLVGAEEGNCWGSHAPTR